MLTTAAVATATAMVVVVESAACWPASARAIVAAAVAIVVVVAVATPVAIAAATPVAIAVVKPAATAANAKSFVANCRNARFAVAFGFRLAKPKKLLAPGIVANAFASKFHILAAEPFAYLARSKFNAA